MLIRQDHPLFVIEHIDLHFGLDIGLIKDRPDLVAMVGLALAVEELLACAVCEGD
jgi:hypothetical protein